MKSLLGAFVFCFLITAVDSQVQQCSAKDKDIQKHLPLLLKFMERCGGPGGGFMGPNDHDLQDFKNEIYNITRNFLEFLQPTIYSLTHFLQEQISAMTYQLAQFQYQLDQCGCTVPPPPPPPIDDPCVLTNCRTMENIKNVLLNHSDVMGFCNTTKNCTHGFCEFVSNGSRSFIEIILHSCEKTPGLSIVLVKEGNVIINGTFFNSTIFESDFMGYKDFVTVFIDINPLGFERGTHHLLFSLALQFNDSEPVHVLKDEVVSMCCQANRTVSCHSKNCYVLDSFEEGSLAEPSVQGYCDKSEDCQTIECNLNYNNTNDIKSLLELETCSEYPGARVALNFSNGVLLFDKFFTKSINFTDDTGYSNVSVIVQSEIDHLLLSVYALFPDSEAFLPLFEHFPIPICCDELTPPPPTELCVTSNCDTMGILRDAILRDNNTRGYCYTNEDCTKGVCDAEIDGSYTRSEVFLHPCQSPPGLSIYYEVDNYTIINGTYFGNASFISTNDVLVNITMIHINSQMSTSYLTVSLILQFPGSESIAIIDNELITMCCPDKVKQECSSEMACIAGTFDQIRNQTLSRPGIVEKNTTIDEECRNITIKGLHDGSPFMLSIALSPCAEPFPFFKLLLSSNNTIIILDNFNSSRRVYIEGGEITVTVDVISNYENFSVFNVTIAIVHFVADESGQPANQITLLENVPFYFCCNKKDT